MYKHILIATDGSDFSLAAVEQGLRVAKALGAKATAAYVTEPWAANAPPELAIALPLQEYDRIVAAQAARVRASVDAIAAREGTSCTTVHTKDAYAAEGIIDTAKQQGCDLIVMASHGRRGLSKLLLGSQASKVLTMSPVSVLVCK